MLLEMRGIEKAFGGVHALEGVDFELERGEVHALVGENGAGKSTLMKILSGALRPDRGSILSEGREVHFQSVHDARRNGILMVYQELALVRELSVAENLYLGALPGIVDHGALHRLARELLERIGLEIPTDRKVRELGVGEQQLVTIARAFREEGRILVLDEPTAALTAGETRKLFALIDRLRAEGVAVVYISHRLEEIFEIADRVTVLRDGRKVATSTVGAVDKAEVVRQMVGRELVGYRRPQHLLGERLPEFEVHPKRGKPFRLEVSKGEILGLAGVVGSGRGAAVLAVFGQRGHAIWGSERIDRPHKAIERGAFLVPSDRKTQGLVMPLKVGENVTLSILDTISRLGVIGGDLEREIISGQMRQLSIRPARPEMRVWQYSGGNQQKVVVAKALATRPRVLLLDEPTRGVDVGARAEIYDILCRLADEGLAIIMSSSDTEELISLCDRILVFRHGAPVSELSAPFTTEEVTAHVTGAR